MRCLSIALEKGQKLDEETFSSFAFPACTLLKGFHNSAIKYDIISYFSRFLKKGWKASGFNINESYANLCKDLSLSWERKIIKRYVDEDP